MNTTVALRRHLKVLVEAAKLINGDAFDVDEQALSEALDELEQLRGQRTPLIRDEMSAPLKRAQERFERVRDEVAERMKKNRF